MLQKVYLNLYRRSVFLCKEALLHVSEGLVRSWLLQLCLGLYHLHNELNLIHRDIKMINVLVMENGQLKLSDFGLAKKIGKDEEYSKSTVGTPYYLSP